MTRATTFALLSMLAVGCGQQAVNSDHAHDPPAAATRAKQSIAEPPASPELSKSSGDIQPNLAQPAADNFEALDQGAIVGPNLEGNQGEVSSDPNGIRGILPKKPTKEELIKRFYDSP